MDPFTILAAFMPLITNVVSRVIGRFTGGAKPQTIEEYIAVQRLEVEKLQALAALDNTPGVSHWVQDLRGAMHPVACLFLIVVWAVIMMFSSFINIDVIRIVTDLAGAGTLYLFGERTMFYINRK